MKTLTPQVLMDRRLSTRRFSSLAAQNLAYTLCWSAATHIDIDGLTGTCRAALKPLMQLTRLDANAVYESAEQLVDAGFLTNLDDDMGRDYVTYAIRVQALPPIVATEEQERYALERLIQRAIDNGADEKGQRA